MMFSRTGKLRRAVAAAVVVAAAIIAIPPHGVLARDENAADRYDLAREIPTQHFVLLDEGRIAASYWAAYAYREPVDTGEGDPCAYVGAISFTRPKVGFFHYAGECGPLWPGEGARRPALGFIRQRTFYHGQSRAEGVGLLLVSPAVRRISVHFRGNSVVSAVTTALSGSDGLKARLPALRYATFAAHLDRCITAVTAFDASGKRVGAVRYPNCIR
jgi:hypothetical protein